MEKKTPNDAFSHFAKLERDRQTDTQAETVTGRQKETDRRHRQRQTNTQAETVTGRKKETDRDTERQRQRHCRHRQRDRETDTRTKKRHPRKQKTCSVFSISTSAASSAYMEISRNLA